MTSAPITEKQTHPETFEARLALLAAEIERLRAVNAELVEALQLLHDNIAEYARINNLGGFDNHDMRMARAALRRAQGE